MLVFKLHTLLLLLLQAELFRACRDSPLNHKTVKWRRRKPHYPRIKNRTTFCWSEEKKTKMIMAHPLMLKTVWCKFAIFEQMCSERNRQPFTQLWRKTQLKAQLVDFYGAFPCINHLHQQIVWQFITEVGLMICKLKICECFLQSTLLLWGLNDVAAIRCSCAG